MDIPSFDRKQYEEADIVVMYYGTDAVVSAKTPAGAEWLESYLVNDEERRGDVYVVDPYEMDGIVDGATEFGLVAFLGRGTS